VQISRFSRFHSQAYFFHLHSITTHLYCQFIQAKVLNTIFLLGGGNECHAALQVKKETDVLIVCTAVEFSDPFGMAASKPQVFDEIKQSLLGWLSSIHISPLDFFFV
jgi:hypothetical protein